MQGSYLKPKGCKILFFAAALSLAALAGCEAVEQETHPRKRPNFPSGLAISGKTLTLLSMNYSLRFTSGGIFTIDLDEVESEIKRLESTPPAQRFISGDVVVTSSAYIEALARQAIIVSGGNPAKTAVLFQNRAEETLQAVQLENGQLKCNGQPHTGPVFGQDCVNGKGILTLKGREPYTMDTLPLATGATFPRIVMGYLGSDQIDVVELNQDNGYPAHVVDSAHLLDLVDRKDLREHVGDQVQRARVRSVKVLAEGHNGYAGETLVFAAVEFKLSIDPTFIDATAARIVWFPVSKLLDGSLDKSDLGEWNITSAINSKGVSDLEVVVENGVARLYALLTKPDAIVRADLKTIPKGTTLKSAVLRRILETCDHPLQLNYLPKAQKLIMGCYDGAAQASIRLLDPGTLKRTHILSRFGRGLGAFKFDEDRNRVYVSYGINGTVGVLQLSDLSPKGHIFPNAPRNLPGGT